MRKAGSHSCAFAASLDDKARVTDGTAIAGRAEMTSERDPWTQEARCIDEENESLLKNKSFHLPYGPCTQDGSACGFQHFKALHRILVAAFRWNPRLCVFVPSRVFILLDNRSLYSL